MNGGVRAQSQTLDGQWSAAPHRRPRRRYVVSVKHTGVVPVIRAAVAAIVGNSNAECSTLQYLSVKAALAKERSVEGRRRSRGSRRLPRIRQRPHSDYRQGLARGNTSRLVQRTDNDGQGAVGLSGKLKEVSSSVAAQPSCPIPRGRDLC